MLSYIRKTTGFLHYIVQITNDDIKQIKALYRNKQSNGQHMYVIRTLHDIAVVTTYSQGKINKKTAIKYIT